MALIRKSEDNSQEPVLLFHCVGPRHPIQAVRFDGKPLLAEVSCWALGIGFLLR